jgi:hypothetical protein
MMIVLRRGDGVGGWQRRASANVAVRGPRSAKMATANDQGSEKQKKMEREKLSIVPCVNVDTFPKKQRLSVAFLDLCVSSLRRGSTSTF